MKNLTNNLARSLTTFALSAMAILSVMAIFTSLAVAQDLPSTDRDNPTPFTSNVVTGDGVDEKTEYFYSFVGGPGEVNVSLDVKAEKGVAVSSVDIALFDAKSKKLMSTYANPDHGSSKHAVETVKVKGTQTLLLEVTVSPGVDTFKIKVDGAVTILTSVGGSVGAADPTKSPAPSPSPTPSPSPEEGQTSPDSSSTTTDTTAADSSAAAGDASHDAGAAPANAAAGSTKKVAKVNSKINGASATLSGIITAAGSAADSVKGLKKRSQ